MVHIEQQIVEAALAAAFFLLGQRMVDVGEQIDLQGNQRVFFGHVLLIQIMAEIGQGLQAGECGCIGALAFFNGLPLLCSCKYGF